MSIKGELKDIIEKHWQRGREGSHQRTESDERSEGWTDPENDTIDDPSELPYPERVEYWRDPLPDPYAERYDALLAMNCSPRIARAVCEYVAGQDGAIVPKSQREVAAEYDISTVTLRKWYNKLSENTPEHATEPRSGGDVE